MNTKKAIVDFIIIHNEEKGYSPTFREIADAVGLLSVSSVHKHISDLADQGYIKRQPHSPRTLEVLASYGDSPALKVLALRDGVPTIIQFRGNRYVLDPTAK